MEAGTKVGPYELVGPLGVGGMGEVYRARDQRIGRDVAVKVLPAALSTDPDRMRRLELEARSAGSLNHPNLVTIYELGTHESRPYIAMELLEGESLRQKIGRAGNSDPRIPLRKAIDYSIQIANGLAAAHEKGIIHRDLKPENIIVTHDGRVKILDFGLAKQEPPVPSDEEKTATHSDQLHTAPGTIIGTASYMSPEQVRGQGVDHRSDIFSAGAILYEMLSGSRAFQGDSAVETMNAILKEEPSGEYTGFSRVPPAVNRVVLRCLEKDREQRFQSARDLGFALQAVEGSTFTGFQVARPATRVALRRLTIGLVVVAGLAAAFFAGRQLRRPRPAPEWTGFRQLTFRAGAEGEPALAPDGKMFAYFSAEDGDEDIYVQRLDGRNAINLTADSTSSDRSPAFSPDGSLLAFSSMRDGGGIYVMGATGESVRRLTTFGAHPTWAPNGREIAFCTEQIDSPSGRSHTSQLWVVDAATGTRRQIHSGDAVQPSWSPNGELIVFWAIAEGAQRDLAVIPAGGGRLVRLMRGPALVNRPVWSPDGRFVYFLSDRSGTSNLWRIGVSPDGEPASAPEAVTLPASSVGWFSIGGQTIAYTSLTETMVIDRTPVDSRSLEPKERAKAVISGTMLIRSFDVSLDGTMIAFSTEGRQEDVFVVRSDGTSLRQLTNDAARDRGVRWSPDGQHVAFYSNRGGNYEIWSVRADGSSLEQLTSIGSPNNWHPQWSPDARFLAVTDPGGSLIVELGARKAPQRLPPLGDKEVFWATSWSRDGQFISGNAERDEDGGAAIWSVRDQSYERLTNDAVDPEWLSDSRRLVYRSVSRGTLMLYDTATRKTRELPFSPSGRIRDRLFAISADSLYTATLRTEADVWTAHLDATRQR